MWRRPNVARGFRCCLTVTDSDSSESTFHCIFGFDDDSAPHSSSQESGLQWGASFVRQGAKPDPEIVQLRDLCERRPSQYFANSKAETIVNHDISQKLREMHQPIYMEASECQVTGFSWESLPPTLHLPGRFFDCLHCQTPSVGHYPRPSVHHYFRPSSTH